MRCGVRHRTGRIHHPAHPRATPRRSEPATDGHGSIPAPCRRCHSGNVARPSSIISLLARNSIGAVWETHTRNGTDYGLLHHGAALPDKEQDAGRLGSGARVTLEPASNARCPAPCGRYPPGDQHRQRSTQRLHGRPRRHPVAASHNGEGSLCSWRLRSPACCPEPRTETRRAVVPADPQPDPGRTTKEVPPIHECSPSLPPRRPTDESLVSLGTTWRRNDV